MPPAQAPLGHGSPPSSPALTSELCLIAAAAQIGQDSQWFKSYTARRIIHHLKVTGATRLLSLLARYKPAHTFESEHPRWEEGSHPQRIESKEVMHQKPDSIHLNPVRGCLVEVCEYCSWSKPRATPDLRGPSRWIAPGEESVMIGVPGLGCPLAPRLSGGWLSPVGAGSG